MAASMGSQRRVGALLGYASILAKNLVNLAYTPMLLSFIGKGDYGVFEMANSTVYSLTLLTFGFSGAYARFYMQRAAKNNQADIRRLNGMYLMLYAVISIAALILGAVLTAGVDSGFSASLTESETKLLQSLVAIMSVNIAVTLFSTVFDGFILVRERFVFQQSRQLATTLATPFLAYALLLGGVGAVGAAIAQLAVNAVLLVLNIRFSVGVLGTRFDFSVREPGLFSALLAFSAWIFLNQACDIANQTVPNIVLGAVSGSAAVAVFAIAMKIRALFISLSTTLSGMYIPEVNRIEASSNDNHALTSVFARVGHYQSMLLWWVYFGFMVVGKWFISVWAGKDFADAYYLILIMTAPLLIPLTQNVGIEISRAKNLHKARSIACALVACGGIAATLYFAPRFGYWAAAGAYACTIFVGNGIWMNWYYQCRLGLDTRAYWARVLPTILCAASAGVLCLLGTSLMPVSGIGTCLLWGGAYTCLYFILTWYFVLIPSEREQVIRKVFGNNGK